MYMLHSFNDKRQNKKRKIESLHELGYQIFRNAIDIDQKILSNVQKNLTKLPPSIFNHNEANKRNDHKRRQRNLSLRNLCMKNFDTKVKEFVNHKVNTELMPTDPVIIHSLPGCQPQAAHCDYIPDEALKAVSDEQMPLALVICLMEETKLMIWPNSSRLATATPGFLADIQPISCEEVKLAPGDIIVFRGDFVHAGSGYTQANSRIHYYLDSPLVPRTRNQTWLVHKNGSNALRSIIKTEISEKYSNPRNVT